MFTSKTLNYVIRVSTDGVVIVNTANDEAASEFTWKDVERIDAYKLDLVTTDCLCLAFTTGRNSSPVQVSEEWPGFEELLVTLQRNFPLMPPDWRTKVIHPAFARNETVLYEGGAASAA